MDVSKPVFDFSTISWNISEIYFYFNKLYSSSSFSDISDFVREEKHYESNNTISENQLKRGKKEWSCLQLNGGDKNSHI